MNPLHSLYNHRRPASYFFLFFTFFSTSLAVSSSHLFDLFPYLVLLLYSISLALSSVIGAAAVLLQEASEVL
ncbi:hypothetical protein Pyn_06820 [Prunus yedoensis var. nudiflora]|uniref:Uncharacterized protein n=1 Tax=Prunus yedoensis var. nudiflora TaxID=2094558 RepID=A0A314YXK4_PRUYE|nr:hypothetical protein Pyn_06820 [Prunus yedoensis var. nudiflora]